MATTKLIPVTITGTALTGSEASIDETSDFNSGLGDGAFVTSGTNEQTGTSTISMSNLPLNAGSINSAFLRVRARLAGDATPDDAMTWTITATAFSTVTFATSGGSTTDVVEITKTGGNMDAPTAASINSLNITVDQTAWTREMGSDNLYLEIEYIELEVDYEELVPDVQQEHYRFCGEPGSAIDITGSAHEAWTLVGTVDTAKDVYLDEPIALIIKLGNDTFATATETWQLEYKVDSGSWTDVNATSSNVRSYASGDTDDATSTTERLTTTSRTFNISQLDEGNGALARFLGADTDHEFYYSIIFRSADLSGDEVITFRLTSAGETVTYDITPTATAIAIVEPTVISTTMVDAAAADSSVGITVPSDCTMVIASWSQFDANTVNNMSACDIDSAAFTFEQNVGDTGNAAGYGIAYLETPSTGSQTFSWTWTGTAQGNGAAIALTFIKGQSATNPVRDSDGDTSATPTLLRTTLTTEDTNLIIANLSAYQAFVAFILNGGTLLEDDYAYGDVGYDVARIGSDAVSTDVDSSGNADTVVAIAIRGAPAAAGGTATGSPSVYLPTASGAAQITKTSTGSPSVTLPTSSGDATVPVTHTATGAPSTFLPTASGAAEVIKKATGAAALLLITAAGAADTFTEHQATGDADVFLPTASGVAEVIHTATGAADIVIPTASGTATITRAATGAPEITLPTASGAAEVAKTATGAPSVLLPTAAGAAEITNTATGAVSVFLPTASGAAQITKLATGAVSTFLPTAAGTTALTRFATGSPSITLLTSEGDADADAGTGETADGAPSVYLPTAAGTASIVFPATGSPSTILPTASGAAEVAKTATGSPSVYLPTASGAAEITKTATGSPSTFLPTAAGTAEISNTATGAAATFLPTAAGTAQITKTATGAATTFLPTAAGIAEIANTATGAATTFLPTAAGTAQITKTATGSPSTLLPTAAGTTKLTRSATGAPSITLLTADGDAQAEGVANANGSPSVFLLTAAGTTALTRSATGAPSVLLPTASGAAQIIKTAAGSPSVFLPTAAGAAEISNTATGAPSVYLPTASGAAVMERSATGAPSITLPTAAGDAEIELLGDVVTVPAGDLNLVTRRGLKLQGYPPSIAPSYIVEVGEETLTLSSQPPFTAPTVSVPATALALSGKPVNIVTAPAINITVAEVALTFSGQSVDRGRGLLLTTYIPELIFSTPLIDTVQLALATYAPTATNTSPPPLVVPSTQLELTGNNLAWTITQLPKISSLILEFPTFLVTDSSPTFFPPVAPLVLSGQDLISDVVSTPDEGTLALTGHVPTLLEDINHLIRPEAERLYFASEAPLFFPEGVASPPAGTLTLTGYAPPTNATITVPVRSLILSGWWPIAVERDSYAIEVEEETLALAGQIPVVNVGPNITVPEATLQLTGAVPVVDVTHGSEVPAAAVILTGYAPLLNETVTLSPPAAALILEGQEVAMEYRRIRHRSGGRKRLISRTVVTKLRHLRTRH